MSDDTLRRAAEDARGWLYHGLNGGGMKSAKKAFDILDAELHPPETEVVPLDEPSMEDYPPATADLVRLSKEEIEEKYGPALQAPDDFGAPIIVNGVRVRDGVRDSESR